MSPQQQLQVYVAPDGQRFVGLDQLIETVERDLDRVQAELMAVASRYEGDVRKRLEAGIADAIAATRERLAQQAEALRTTGRRLA
jgi:D-alanyl-D-alanine dipeptidase